MKTVKVFLTLVLFVCLTTIAFGGDSNESTTSRASIKDRFAKVLNDQLGVELVRFSEEARFREELRADNTDLAELLMALEESFDIEVSNADWEGVTTIKSAIDLIIDYKSSRSRRW